MVCRYVSLDNVVYRVRVRKKGGVDITLNNTPLPRWLRVIKQLSTKQVAYVVVPLQSRLSRLEQYKYATSCLRNQQQLTAATDIASTIIKSANPILFAWGISGLLKSAKYIPDCAYLACLRLLMWCGGLQDMEQAAGLLILSADQYLFATFGKGNWGLLKQQQFSDVSDVSDVSDAVNQVQNFFIRAGDNSKLYLLIASHLVPPKLPGIYCVVNMGDCSRINVIDKSLLLGSALWGRL